MRLLQHAGGDDYVLTESTSDNELLPYAILSHTWIGDKEVTFDELNNGTGKSKPGYKKIQLCGKQAQRDGLQYFWVDTCSIDKSDPIELREAINSMFRWYQKAVKCYVYLPDVSAHKRKVNDEDTDYTWEPAFQASRWFTRGWTLQELLAPSSVEFFTKEWTKIGDKRSLKQQIRKVTGIPELALEGAHLSQFSVNERLLWKENRQTTVDEDIAYSLLGIFGVYITPIYGEGAAEAFRRLLCEVDKLHECIQDLHLTNTRDDKIRIEDTKGGLLKDSYRWVLENREFRQWQDEPQNQLLWVKGDPGKGKTMLLCGIINELEISASTTNLLSYFFCQATDPRINTATSVLRGLMYMLVVQQPSLVSHIRKRYDHAGKAVFQDVNAWMALSEVFTNMLEDPHLTRVFLVVDALDECVTDLSKLLDFINQKSSETSRVKWIVSSRNLPDIEEQLAKTKYGVRLSLELNADSISTAVRSYIEHKVDELAARKRYNDQTRQAVLNHLSSNAQDTFLWVALACQTLEGISKWNVTAHLKSFPPGLSALYERMINQIGSSDGAELSKKILALMATVYRPITLRELVTLVEQIEVEADDHDSLVEIVGFCGSFLTLRGDTIYFVHQSAKDFICRQAAHEIFPSGKEETHRILLTRSLQAMSSAVIRRDMYHLGKLDYPIAEVKQPNPDPLGGLRYSCIYWIDHLCECNSASASDISGSLQEEGLVEVFLSTKYLYWLEALSLCQSMSKGVASMVKLEGLTGNSTYTTASVKDLIYDAYRFIMYHKTAIENYPLQTYVSALLFTPTRSIIRRLFEEEAPKWVADMSGMHNEWDACLQTFDNHDGPVLSVVFSHNSHLLASTSASEIHIWDVASGQCLRTLPAPRDCSFDSIDFSHDTNWLATASSCGTVHIWNAVDGKCLRILGWPGTSLFTRDDFSLRSSVTFSHDSVSLVCIKSSSCDIVIWDINDGKCRHIWKAHNNAITSVSISHDSKRLASASSDGSCKIWDTNSGTCLGIVVCKERPMTVTLLDDSRRLIVSSLTRTTLFNWKEDGIPQKFINGARSLTLSHDSTQFAYVPESDPLSITTHDISTGKHLRTLQGHADRVRSISYSQDSRLLASASTDKTVKIWDLGIDEGLYLPFKLPRSLVTSMVLSHDSTLLALATEDISIEIRNIRSGKSLHTLYGHSYVIESMEFSIDSTRFVSASGPGLAKLWDLKTGNCLRSIDCGSEPKSMAFIPSSLQLVTILYEGICKVWDMFTGECVRRFDTGNSNPSGTACGFSHGTRELVFKSTDLSNMLRLWDISSGELLWTKVHTALDGFVHVVSIWDSKWIFTQSRFGVLRIWDMGTGDCLHTFRCDVATRRMICDASGSYLFTDVGTIDINATLSATNNVRMAAMDYPQVQYRGLSVHNSWIACGSDRLVWLPPGFRSVPRRDNRSFGRYKSHRVGEKVVCILDGSDRLCTYSFDLDQLPDAHRQPH